MRLVDHAGGRPGAQAVKEAGYDGAIRYLANSPERGLPNKILLPEEARGYLERNMPLVSNWQKGKHETADWRRGRAGGKADAESAARHHALCGGNETAPIFFSIDEDVNIKQWNDLCAPYLRGVADVIGKQRTGVYGGLRPMYWALEDELVGSNGQGKFWLWQTKAWSTINGVRTWHPLTVLRQELVVPPDSAFVAKIPVDVNFTYADNFGQWNLSLPQMSNEDKKLQFILEQLMGPA